MIGRPLCRRLLWYMVSVTAVVDLVYCCYLALFKQTPWVSNWNEQNLYYQQNEVGFLSLLSSIRNNQKGVQSYVVVAMEYSYAFRGCFLLPRNVSFVFLADLEGVKSSCDVIQAWPLNRVDQSNFEFHRRARHPNYRTNPSPTLEYDIIVTSAVQGPFLRNLKFFFSEFISSNSQVCSHHCSFNVF